MCRRDEETAAGSDSHLQQNGERHVLEKFASVLDFSIQWHVYCLAFN